MNKSKIFAIAITLGSIITITGCGVQKTKLSTVQSNNQATSTNIKITSIDEASENMRNLLKDLKTQLANKEEANAIKTSDGLEENWSSIENTVKAKNPALYEKVESPLGIIEAGVKVKPIDEKTITTASNTLNKALTEVQVLR